MAPIRSKKVAEGLAGWRSLLATRDFGWLWAGQVISQIGEGLSKVALLWFVYNLTGSALKMTVVGILQTVPPLVLGPFAGAYIDRIPKRAAMIVIDIARAGLLVLIPILYAMDLLTLTWLYVLVFVVALFSMAFGPALNAAIPLMVEQDQLTRANAIMQSSMTIGQLLGPAISGILIALIGSQNVLYVNAVAFVISALSKIPIHIPHKRVAGDMTAANMIRDLRDGFRFVFVKHRMLLLLMVIAALFTLGATGFVYLLPVIGERVLHANAVELGWLWSSLSAGILIATAWLAWKNHSGMCARLWIMAGSALLAGIAIFGLTFIDKPIFAAFLIIIIGGGSGLVTPIVSAALQEMTPKDLLARVFSVFNTGTMALAMLGMTVFGWAADAFGPTLSLTAIGAVTLGSAVVTALMVPWCRRMAPDAAPSHGTA